jgi:hypothetical protein
VMDCAASAEMYALLSSYYKNKGWKAIVAPYFGSPT